MYAILSVTGETFIKRSDDIHELFDYLDEKMDNIGNVFYSDGTRTYNVVKLGVYGSHRIMIRNKK